MTEYSAVQKARLSMLAAYAEGIYLNAVGMNAGVPRPYFLTDDVLYSKIVRLLGWQPKQIFFTVYKLLEILFGTQADLEDAGQRSWKVYCVRAHEIVVEIPYSLVQASLEIATYTPGISGFVRDSSTESELTVFGNIAADLATTLVGKTLWILIDGTWESQTISTVVYNPAPDDYTEIQVGSFYSTDEFGGALYFIDVPGDGTSLHRGAFIGTSTFETLFAANAGVTTTTLVVVGDAKIHWNVGHTISLLFDGEEEEVTIATIADYDVTTNSTTITFSPAIPGSVSGVAYRIGESAGGTNLPVSDRIYDFDGGLYRIAEFYFNALMLSAGVKARLELVGG